MQQIISIRALINYKRNKKFRKIALLADFIYVTEGRILINTF